MKLLKFAIALSLAALVWLLWELSPTVHTPRKATTTEATNAATAGFVILGARVFDGEKLWPRADVRVAAGRIEAIGESLEVPADYARIDASGKTLLPGLIDAHVHTWGEARRDALRFGVTTMLDQFSDHRALAAATSERESIDATGRADLWSAGTLATAAGGHGTQFGMDIPTLARPGEAAAWVAARKAEGSDWIKLVREDLRTFTGKAQLPTLDDVTAAAVIAAAHENGLRAVVHASSREHARTSLRDGADGLVHGFEDELADDEFIALARERQAFVIATLTVVAGMSGERASVLDDARVAPWLDGGQKQTLAADFGFGKPDPRLIDRARENVRRLHVAGITILAGSDAPNPNTAHGAALHEELAQLVRAGLSPEQALVAATSAPARAFGLADRGRIAAGQRADLLLVSGNPFEDIRATRGIAMIWKNGQRVSRDRDAPSAVAERWNGGALSHFDGASLDASSGIGWSPTTDRIAGGASEVALSFVAPGANRSAHALKITGTVVAGAAWPWSGAIYGPGRAMMQPVDGSDLKEIVFEARGDGREYSVLLFSGAEQAMPAMQSFIAGPQWQQVRIPLAAFQGGDVTRIRAIGITAGLPHGAFALEIDEVGIVAGPGP
jgi:imidazolonepropionase-like amidohydrolase